MKELFNTIFKAFDSSPFFNNALSGRYTYGKAQKNAEYPYIVYSSYTTTDNDTFSANIKEVPIQINIYSNDSNHSESFELLNQCEYLFKNTVLPVENHFGVALTKEFEVPPVHDGEIWMATIEFSCLLQKL